MGFAGIKISPAQKHAGMMDKIKKVTLARGYFRHPAFHPKGQLAAVQIVPDDLVPTYKT